MTVRIALYARVSTSEQNNDNQLIALRQWGANSGNSIVGEYVDVVSSRDTRPQKEAVLRKLRLGELDGVCFFALDRWGRNMSELVLELEEFSKSGKSMISLKEGLDLSTAAGMMMCHVLSAMANFERARLRERTMLGLSRARAQGKKLGRKPTLDAQKIIEMRATGASYSAIATAFQCSKTAVSNIVQKSPPANPAVITSLMGISATNRTFTCP